jgi:hypothetical protein
MPLPAMPGLLTTLRAVRCLAAGLRRVACWSAIAGVLLLPLVARADKPQWAYRTFPFAQALNLEAVYEVTHSAPEQLIATIRRWGVGVQLVRSDAPVLPVNPLLAGLPPAAPELVRRADFRDTYEGMVIFCSSTRCALGRDTILIRDTALSYTLIHEFVQSLLRPLCTGEPDDSLEARFRVAFRRLVFYQRRLYDDPYKLLNPLWRRDILAAQADVAKDLFGRIRLGQSQEAIVEKVLSLYIDERNPFFDADRRAQGLQYGEVMINNAIDMFNELNDSVVFVEDAVRNLRQSLRDGNIEPGEGVALTDDDEASVARSARDVEAHLAVVRAELQVLKQSYSR